MVDEKDWDDHFPDGVYAVPPDPNEARVKVRKLVDYCRTNGIPLSEIHRRLPPEVMEQFLVYPTEEGEQEKKRE